MRVKVKRKSPLVKDTSTCFMEYRVIFLGDSEAGKTLIMSRLEDTKMDPADYKESTTNGIKTFHTTECLNGQSVRINYWDFGGQEILHSMHRMFLSENALYVIVLNTRNDNQDAQANFWIRYVQTYAPMAPIMLVMNKIDQNKRADLNLPALSRQFDLELGESNVLKISAIEPDTERFQHEFTQKLHQQVAQCIEYADPFLPWEAQIRDELRKRKEKVISTDAFREICEQYGINEANYGENFGDFQKSLAFRFNEAGIIVAFKKVKGNDDELLEPVVLKPEWLTSTIYRILNTEKPISKNGIVLHNQIKQICRTNNDKWQGSRDADDLLAIMRNFDLSYADTDDVQEFIPMLCQRREPEEIEDLAHADGTIKFQMAYEYLPSGVLYKMMVKHQKELDIEMTWRTGAKIGLDDENYVILRQDGNVMNLYARCTTKACAVAKMKEFVKEISTYAEEERYQAKSLENKIGFDIAGITDYFDYDRLVNAESAKVEYVISKVNNGRVSISDILAQEDRSEQRNLEKLLRHILIGCIELQDNQTYWWRDKLSDETESHLPKMDEDSRTRMLKTTIGDAFVVEDQHKGGESQKGIRPGEMDLRFCLVENMPWSILEALNITNETDTPDKSKSRWLEHLERLTTKYNKSGFRYLILMSYLLSPVEEFNLIKEAYHKLLQETELKVCGGKPESCEYYEELKNCPERISISRADYSGPAGDVSVFHFLVHIPKYTGKQEETSDKATKKETKKTDLAQ